MKTREELAREHANERARQDGSGTWTVMRNTYIAGFDAGFARAVEMLRSKTGFDGVRLDLPPSPQHWADWLEKEWKR